MLTLKGSVNLNRELKPMNILCPIDFSDTSLNALEYAVRIGEKHDAHLTMLYVFTEEEFNKKLTTKEVKSFGEYRDDE